MGKKKSFTPPKNKIRVLHTRQKQKKIITYKKQTYIPSFPKNPILKRK